MAEVASGDDLRRFRITIGTIRIPATSRYGTVLLEQDRPRRVQGPVPSSTISVEQPLLHDFLDLLQLFNSLFQVVAVDERASIVLPMVPTIRIVLKLFADWGQGVTHRGAAMMGSASGCVLEVTPQAFRRCQLVLPDASSLRTGGRRQRPAKVEHEEAHTGAPVAGSRPATMAPAAIGVINAPGDRSAIARPGPLPLLNLSTGRRVGRPLAPVAHRLQHVRRARHLRRRRRRSSSPRRSSTSTAGECLSRPRPFPGPQMISMSTSPVEPAILIGLELVARRVSIAKEPRDGLHLDRQRQQAAYDSSHGPCAASARASTDRCDQRSSARGASASSSMSSVATAARRAGALADQVLELRAATSDGGRPPPLPMNLADRTCAAAQLPVFTDHDDAGEPGDGRDLQDLRGAASGPSGLASLSQVQARQVAWSSGWADHWPK